MKRNTTIHGNNFGREKPKFHFSIVIIILIMTIIAAFLFYMAHETEKESTDHQITVSEILATAETVTSPVTTEATTTEEITEPTEKVYNPVPESMKKDFSYFNDCVFIGDSITSGLSAYGILKEQNVIASIGNNIDKINNATVKVGEEEIPIQEAVKRVNPKYIYIMLGSNGVGWLSNEHMVKYYTVFINSLKQAVPNAVIYILAIPPVTVDREKMDNGLITNNKIDLYNSNLLSMCTQEDVFFVDINTALKGNDGKFPLENAAKDGMHFKKNTYNIMLDYILSHTLEDNYFAQTEVPATTHAVTETVATAEQQIPVSEATN